MAKDAVISSPDLKSINEEPTLYHEQGLDLAVLKAVGIKNFRDYILEYTYGLIIFNPGFQTFSVQFQGKDQKNFLPFSPSYQLLVCQSFTGHQADRVPHHDDGVLPADVVTGDEFVDVSVHVLRGEVVECSMTALLQQRPE